MQSIKGEAMLNIVSIYFYCWKDNKNKVDANKENFIYHNLYLPPFPLLPSLLLKENKLSLLFYFPSYKSIAENSTNII